MHILDRVASVIRSHKLINQNDHVVVAVSGGADSLALLHILSGIDLSLNLTAMYVDHGLRPLETPSEQKTIADCCLALHIPFQVRRVNVHALVAGTGKSLEDAARILRYGELEKYRRECGADLIAVGHNADDQVEEFFIRLIRGSSSSGLSGMKLRRDNIVRPLLFEKKSQLIEFLTDRGINWCLDSSNLDRQFLRNRVRLDLLPRLEEYFSPALRKTVLQNMDVLREEDNFLTEYTETAYNQCVRFLESSPDGTDSSQLVINKSKFLDSHPAIQRRILEKSCWQMAIRPTYDRICILIEFIKNGRSGGELHLDDGVRAEKSPSELLLGRPLPKGQVRGSKLPVPSINQTIPCPGIYNIFGTNKELIIKEMQRTADQESVAGELRIDLDKITFPLLLRSFLPGEKFSPYGGLSGSGSKKISRYFNERKIPFKERPAWPLLLSGNRVVAIVGLQLDHNFRISTNTGKILSILWRAREE